MEKALVFMELETLMVVARDAVDRVIKTSVRFTKKAGRLKELTLQTAVLAAGVQGEIEMENKIAAPRPQGMPAPNQRMRMTHQEIPHEETTGDEGPEGRMLVIGWELAVPQVARIESFWPSLVDVDGQFCRLRWEQFQICRQTFDMRRYQKGALLGGFLATFGYLQAGMTGGENKTYTWIWNKNGGLRNLRMCTERERTGRCLVVTSCSLGHQDGPAG